MPNNKEGGRKKPIIKKIADGFNNVAVAASVIATGAALMVADPESKKVENPSTINEQAESPPLKYPTGAQEK